MNGKQVAPVGLLIRHLRGQKRMYNQTLADLSGVSSSCITAIENGNTQSLRTDVIDKLATYFEKPKELFYDPLKFAKDHGIDLNVEAQVEPEPEPPREADPEPEPNLDEPEDPRRESKKPALVFKVEGKVISKLLLIMDLVIEKLRK